MQESQSGHFYLNYLALLSGKKPKTIGPVPAMLEAHPLYHASVATASISMLSIKCAAGTTILVHTSIRTELVSLYGSLFYSSRAASANRVLLRFGRATMLQVFFNLESTHRSEDFVICYIYPHVSGLQDSLAG